MTDKQLPAKDAPAAKNPQTKKQQEIIQAVIAEVTEHYQGPIPSAREFAAYERVQKGAANRILGMAERSLKAEVRFGYLDRWGQIISMLIGKLFLYFLVVCTVYLVLHDKPVEALLTGLAPLVSVIYSTVTNRSEDSTKK